MEHRKSGGIAEPFDDKPEIGNPEINLLVYTGYERRATGLFQNK
jgi:hypothetical protein